MKILILTGKFGMGHYSAASSLAKQVANINPEAEIVLCDIFEYVMPTYSDQVYQAFGTIVTHYSHAYNRYYNHMEQKGPNMRPAFLSYFIKKLKELLEREHPDAILSTLPLCSQIVSWYKEETKSTLPLITCITDISSHSEWINEHTDCYLAANRDMKNRLMEKGVEGTRIYVYGIPVRPEFDMGQVKQGASDGRKHILIMGGGLGILPESRTFYEALNQSGRIKVTVITGKNRDIYQKLYGRYENIDVIGYTDEVYRYMKEADAVISKPGGITLFETIHSGTPILVLEPFLQQEINNTGFIINQGIGMVLEKHPEACVREISEIIQDHVLMDGMKRNLERLQQEYDQTSIRRMLSLIGERDMEVCMS
ncbi:MAG: glycosyltransferase [Clostridium sp.]